MCSTMFWPFCSDSNKLEEDSVIGIIVHSSSDRYLQTNIWGDKTCSVNVLYSIVLSATR